MPNFSIAIPTSPEFDGQFRIEANPSHAPTDTEKVYVDAVNAAVDKLRADDAADVAANYPEELLKARRVARQTAASGLLSDARAFVRGDNTAGQLTRVTEILNSYAARVARFCAVAVTPEQSEIVFASEYVSIGQEVQAFLDAIKAAGDERAADARADKSPGFSPNVIKARAAQRESVAELLRDQVNEFWTGPLSPNAATERVLLTRGQYQAQRDRLNKRLFNVHRKQRNANDKREDVDIRLFSGLPPPDDKPSQDKVELYVLINKTITVIRSVCDSIRDRAKSGTGNYREEADLLYADFVEKLEGIAVIGLELEFTALAKATLEEARHEFFVRAAGRIKTIHVNQLGLGAGLTSAALLAVYGSIQLFIWCGKLSATSWAAEHSNFLLAACGAAIGTWASFAARQAQFSFDDLVMAEESALRPLMRILFVMTLTMAACTLFWNGAINIEIGSLKTEAYTFRHSGTVALLIGLFAGLSERALATAITGRAAAFVKGIGAAG
jgi:hypothetical protein